MKLLKAVFFFMFPCVILAQSHFSINHFTVKGDIQEILAEDLDRDGLKELVVIHHVDSNESSRRFISIFWAEPGCKYKQSNSFELEVPGRYSIYDFGSLPGEKEEVLLLMSVNAADYFRWVNHKLEGPNRLVNFSSQLIQLSDGSRLLYNDAFFDWNKDGANELMVMRMNEADIFYFRQNKWLQTTIEIPMDAFYFSASNLRDAFPHGEVRVDYWTPSFFLADRDGDGKSELFAASNKKIWVYKQGADNIYSPKPFAKLAPRIFPDTPSDRRRSQINMQVVDIDRDNRADLIVNLQQGSFFNQKSSVKIFYGKDNWTDPANKNPKPGWASDFTGWVVGPFVMDVNSDNNLDLVAPVVEVGLMEAMKAMVVKEFPFNIRYYFPVNNTLPAQPTSMDMINLRTDFSVGRMVSGFPSINADFNGDGVADLIYGKSDQEISVVIKDRKGQKTARQETIKIDTPLLPYTDDLNGDKKSDIILYYAQQENGKHGDFNVLINQGGW